MTTSGRGIRVAIAFSLASLLTALGCKQILGLNERGQYQPLVVDGGKDAAPPPLVLVTGTCGSLRHPSSTCAACMDEKCCTQANGCHDDAACDPGFDCAASCGDDGPCRARCNSLYTRPDTLVQVNTCREMNCASECGLSCGGFGYQAPGCGGCIRDRDTCCASAQACAKNVDCVKLDLCRSNCITGATSTCPTDCQATFSAGAEDFSRWFECRQNTCGMECLVGANWQCLNAPLVVPRPKATLTSLTFSVTIVDIYNDKPFVGSTAKACRNVDRDCAMPLATGMTDSTGTATLTVPVGDRGFDGYVDFTGGDNTQGSKIFPAIWYPSPAIISPGWRGKIQFVSELSLGILAGLTNATIDPERGLFAANAQDCSLASAGDVFFTAETQAIDVNTKPFYFIGGVPKTDVDGLLRTDFATGIGGFVNIKTGSVIINSSIQIDGEVKRTHSRSYIIRAGAFTTTSMPPVQ